ncbi:nucleoside deaminase [Pacificimonas sp. WHA3]|uniref:tRNA-specific adenosine deaminase n=1 Tax=Pacificimonas pallii TaxID=2827236 RepID=A0ABS6SBC0_9SPHN|nr:nucleoside deaminase [Pacificimonas pallii]MBV7255655.1 nucleoside deaminase [Pacificimonas pallii]
MAAALAQARAAALRLEVPIGAALVLDGEIIAADGNRTRALNDPTAHAEMQVIRAAARKLGQERLEQADLFVTLEPCAMCAGAISHARIRRLYFGAEDAKSGGVVSGARVFAHNTCHHKPDLYPGIGESEAAALLKDFFAARR